VIQLKKETTAAVIIGKCIGDRRGKTGTAFESEYPSLLLLGSVCVGRRRLGASVTQIKSLIATGSNIFVTS
jgi:hypothetical protein